MSKTYAMDELFKQSERFLPVFDQDNQVLTIDNFYANPDDIYDWLTNQQYPLGKYSTERNTENGKRYNDCRITNKVAHPTRIYFAEMERILDQCRRYFHKGEYHWDMIQEFNVFQNIE